jgi:hypothetical protein
MPQCESITRSGDRCKNTCSSNKYCHHHTNTIQEQCSICWTSMNETNSRKLDCGHTFHTRCIDRWKRRNSTCPMCRAPFDQPMYKIRLTIEPDGENMEMRTSNISNIVQMFGLDETHIEEFFTDIQFSVANMNTLHEILRDIGFIIPSSNLTSSNTISTTEF